MKRTELPEANRKKVRGRARKIRQLERNLRIATNTFPPIDLHRGFWHLHLPTSKNFIDSAKTGHRTRRTCVQILIDFSQHLAELKPNSDSPIRVVAAISLPRLWDSQVVVFFGDTHYRDFFNRSSDSQKWEAFRDDRNLVSEWSLRVPDSVRARGFKETIIEDDWKAEGEIWFVGDLS